MTILKNVVGLTPSDSGNAEMKDEGLGSPSPPDNSKGVVQLSGDALDSGLFGEDYKGLDGQKLVDHLSNQYMVLSSTKRTALNVPTKESSEDERKEFYSSIKDVDGVLVMGEGDEFSSDLRRKMGIPENADGYVFPEGRFSEEDSKSLSTLGMELSLSNKQLLSLADMADKDKESHIKSEEFLKSKLVKDRNSVLNATWGEDAQKRFSGAELAVKHLSNEVGGDWLEHFNSSGAVHNPLVIMAMSRYGESLVEKGTLVDTQASYGQTVAEINKRIATIREDKDYYTVSNRAKLLRKELIDLQMQLPD